MLNPTPPEHLVNEDGQPYFLWDSEMTLDEFRTGLRDPDPEGRAYLTGKLMRQASRTTSSPSSLPVRSGKCGLTSSRIWARSGSSGPGCSRRGNQTGMSGNRPAFENKFGWSLKGYPPAKAVET